MPDKYLTVTQLTKYIKYKIDSDQNLNEVFLKGEISNFKAHTRGHYYFTIKDENARINAIMFQTNTKKLKFLPQDGMKVMVTGKISVYEATGGYQIYVNDLLEDGIGNLYVAYEQLKKKLEQEGLFDPSKKKKIPKIPTTVGIITAPTGAAIKDILSTIKRRFPLTKTILFPSLVQGMEASKDIVRNIKRAREFDLDVLIIGRGGGSIEDMWCFNDEEVARTIYETDIPIISAVGHEIDYTISDFVADLRAPTPTGAAEMAVPNKSDVINQLNQLKIRLNKVLSHQLEVAQKTLTQLTTRYILKNPMSIYEVKEEMFSHLIERLKIGTKRSLEKNREKYERLKTHYLLENPTLLYDAKKQNFLKQLAKLETLNPLLTIKRGYAILRKETKVISHKNEVQIGEKLQIELQDGTIDCQVVEGE